MMQIQPFQVFLNLKLPPPPASKLSFSGCSLRHIRSLFVHRLRWHWEGEFVTCVFGSKENKRKFGFLGGECENG